MSRAGERSKRFVRRLHRDAERQHRAVLKPFQQPFPDRAAKRGHVRGAMQQQTIECVALQRGERLGDAGIHGGAHVIARRIGGQDRRAG